VVGTEKSVVVTRCKVGGRTSRRRAYCPRSRQIVVIIVGIVPASTTEFPDEVVSVTDSPADVTSTFSKSRATHQ